MRNGLNRGRGPRVNKGNRKEAWSDRVLEILKTKKNITPAALKDFLTEKYAVKPENVKKVRTHIGYALNSLVSKDKIVIERTTYRKLIRLK
jgi:hypothetical protein